MRRWENASSAYLLINPEEVATPHFLKARYLLLKKLYHSIEINLVNTEQYFHLDEAYNALKEQPQTISFEEYKLVIRNLFLK